MPITLTLQTITKRPNGSVTFQFSDGGGIEYSSLAQAKTLGTDIDSDPLMARAFLIGRWFAVSPDGGNVNLGEGKTVTIDMAQVNSVRIS